MTLLAAKSNYESKLICNFASSKNSKNFQYLGNITSNRIVPLVIKNDNIMASTDLAQANLFNEYYHSIFNNSQTVLMYPEDLRTPSSVLNKVSISELDVYGELILLNVTKAAGIDGIGSRVLKNCALALCLPLHYLFSISLFQQIIPEEWSAHLVVPVQKSGN